MSRRAGDPAAAFELGGAMNTDDPDDVVRFLKEQLAISDFHFRDAVIELLVITRQGDPYHEEECADD